MNTIILITVRQNFPIQNNAIVGSDAFTGTVVRVPYGAHIDVSQEGDSCIIFLLFFNRFNLAIHSHVTYRGQNNMTQGPMLG